MAVFTVISLYAANANRLGPGQMIVPLIFGLFIAGLFILLFWLLKWTSRDYSFWATVYTFVFLFWSELPLPLSVILLIIPYALLIPYTPVIVKLFHKKSKGIKADSVLTILTIVILFGLAASGIQAASNSSGRDDYVQAAESYIYREGKPNIYFIIPDRMPSPAAMREAGIDPDVALAELQGLGFYIAEDNMSADRYSLDTTEEIHTTRTMRYLASVFNGGADIPLDIDYQDCRTMIRENAEFSWLHSHGYKIVNVASWFSETSYFPEADINLHYQNISFLERLFQDEFTTAYYERTLLAGLNFRTLESDSLQQRVETGRLTWQGQEILSIAGSGQTSVFTFAHLMAPHEPFVFADPDISTPEQYYANIRYTLGYLVDLAWEIRRSDPTASIIIQADEGMAYRKPIELNYDLSPRQWSGVFSAWYVPKYSGDKQAVEHTDVLDMVLE